MLSIGSQACSLDISRMLYEVSHLLRRGGSAPPFNNLAELCDGLQAVCAQHQGNVLQTRGIPMLTSIVHAMTAQLLPFLGSWVSTSIEASLNSMKMCPQQ